MKQRYEVVVIGGGIIGCSVAYYLAKEKVDVAVLEGERIGEKTTSAAAGMLGAHSESNDDSPSFFPFARSSQKEYTKLKDELYEYSGVDLGYRKGGILKLTFSEEDKHGLHSLLELPSVDWLDNREVKKMEPTVSPNVLGAAYMKDDVSVIPTNACESFAKSAQILGASLFENHYVYGIEKKDGNYIVQTTQGDVEARHVVVATGVFSNGLFKNLGIAEELTPVKGESIIVRYEKPVLRHTLFHDSCYIVPRNNGELIIGATMVENDWSDTVSLQGVNFLIDKAKALLTTVPELKISGVTAGLRPRTFDGDPLIGRHPEEDRIFVACGHYRNGILLAPATGEMIRDLIVGKEVNPDWVEAFRLNRRQRTMV
ncbi:glycine oxidase ThiO [Oceanobacillus senegalensis]|uniref:glycine oxidase ThiO n=1 Tax=Oceanobacillus senegalensis TaxID=1936063 RepID=UPI000A30BFD2|nr:glycine oxidase ThiO [Oceanobacillus senegalensis]